MATCRSTLDDLLSQLADSFTIAPSGNGCVIETPFEYPDRRVITIHIVEHDSGMLELSDDGYAHAYARISGVSKEALKSRADDLSRRYAVDAACGEVVLTTTASDLMMSMLAVIEASQEIAHTVAHRRVRATSTRLDRQISRTLVMHNRVYDRHGKVPLGSVEIDVDYNILPTDELQQLSLFTMSQGLKLRGAESMAFRIERLLEAPTSPGFSGRVLVVVDEAATFRVPGGWRKIRETIGGTGVDVVPLSEQRSIEQWLTA